MNYKDMIDEAMSSARMLGCLIDLIVALLFAVGMYFLITRVIL
jgi:hypothetical protein